LIKLITFVVDDGSTFVSCNATATFTALDRKQRCYLLVIPLGARVFPLLL